jgi:hypothetical protein
MCFKVLEIIERIINNNTIIVVVIILSILIVLISFLLDRNHCAKKSALCLNNKVQKTSRESSIVLVRNDTLNPCPKKSGPENQKS